MNEFLKDIGELQDIINEKFIGKTIYYIGSQCDKWFCDEYDERCDIGCEKIKTPEIKSLFIRNVYFKQVEFQDNTIRNYVILSNGHIDEVCLSINDLGKSVFLSESDAKLYLESHNIEDIEIHYHYY